MNRTLTERELAHYHREGYVVIKDLFPPEELDAINRDLDAFMRRAEYEPFKGGRENMEGWIMQLGLSTQKAADFCADDRILNIVEPIVHPGIAIYSAKLVSKEPRDGGSVSTRTLFIGTNLPKSVPVLCSSADAPRLKLREVFISPSTRLGSPE